MASSLVWPDLGRRFGFTTAEVSAVRFGGTAHLVNARMTGPDGVIGSIEPIGCHSMPGSSLAWTCGATVAAVRPEESWIDRLGRALGIAWVVISILAAMPA